MACAVWLWSCGCECVANLTSEEKVGYILYLVCRFPLGITCLGLLLVLVKYGLMSRRLNCLVRSSRASVW